MYLSASATSPLLSLGVQIPPKHTSNTARIYYKKTKRIDIQKLNVYIYIYVCRMYMYVLLFIKIYTSLHIQTNVHILKFNPTE